MTEGAGIV